MPWFGKKLKSGDRYDLYGLIVGLVIFAGLGIGLATTAKSPVASWLISFGVGAGAMNVTSFLLRRTIGRAEPPKDDHPSDARYRQG